MTLSVIDRPVAGKTGTAEVSGDQSTSWFVSYDAGKDSKYVTLVVLGDSGTGSEYAAPVARSLWNTMESEGLLEPKAADEPLSSQDTAADLKAAAERAEKAGAETVTAEGATAAGAALAAVGRDSIRAAAAKVAVARITADSE